MSMIGYRLQTLVVLVAADVVVPVVELVAVEAVVLVVVLVSAEALL